MTTATAAKSGYGSSTKHTDYGDYYGTASGHLSHKMARPSRPLPEPSQTAHEPRHFRYFRSPKPLRAGDITVITKIGDRPKPCQLAGKSTRSIQPKSSMVSHPAVATPAKQAQSAKAFAMHVEHLNFLKRVSSGPEAAITPETAERATKAWQQIWVASGRKIPVPSACTNADGKVFYTWDSGSYHLDIDIAPGEPADVFFCDREKDDYWYEDYQIGSPLPEEVVAKLHLFI